MTIEEKEKIFEFAKSTGFIREINASDKVHNIIKKNFNYRYLGYFGLSIIISLICCFILFIALNSKITIINIMIFILILSPIIVLVEFFKKKKVIKNRSYKCYIGKIEKIIDDKNYRIYGLDFNITFMREAKSKNIDLNNEVVILLLKDDIYLLDYNLLYALRR